MLETLNLGDVKMRKALVLAIGFLIASAAFAIPVIVEGPVINAAPNSTVTLTVEGIYIPNGFVEDKYQNYSICIDYPPTTGIISNLDGRIRPDFTVMLMPIDNMINVALSPFDLTPVEYNFSFDVTVDSELTDYQVLLVRQDLGTGATIIENLATIHVPEPASLAIFALGGFLLKRRK